MTCRALKWLAIFYFSPCTVRSWVHRAVCLFVVAIFVFVAVIPSAAGSSTRVLRLRVVFWVLARQHFTFLWGDVASSRLANDSIAHEMWCYVGGHSVEGSAQCTGLVPAAWLRHRRTSRCGCRIEFLSFVVFLDLCCEFTDRLSLPSFANLVAISWIA